MALQSQAPRSGGSRSYGGRRKKSLTPWLILLGLVVIVAGLVVLFSDSDDPSNTANADPADQTGDQPVRPGTTTQFTPPDRNDPPSITNGALDLPSDNGQAVSQGRPPSQTNDPRVEEIVRRESGTLLGETKDQYEIGLQQLESGDIPVGRALLSELLFREGALPRHEAQAVRDRLQHINENTIFSRKLNSEQIAKDPIISLHRVQSGEYLSTIGNTYRIPYQLIERINNVDARRIQADQRIQVINGPVHARVDKSDYRMDLYVEDPNGVQVYLKSYTVGLGEFDSTPIGKWIVKPGSKVGPANGGPSWVNPRTGERFDRNDPDIPIGEYWMALQGIDDNTKDKKGYGIHATNDPESIGRQESMGCIRMRDEDVDQVFYTLFEGASVVEIVP